MIIPEGGRLKLDPKDEHQHVPEAAANYNESVYLDVFDTGQKIGAWVRIGNRPHEGHAEVSVCVYLPDGRVAFWFCRPKITSNLMLAAGGLSVEVVEPFRRLLISYFGETILLDDPQLLRNPREVFKSQPRTMARISLDVAGISPMAGGEIVNPDGSSFALDPAKCAYRGHFEQHVRAVGAIEVGEESFQVSGYGYRDKSWGPRHWQNLHWHKWMPVTFGRDFGLMVMLQGRPGTSPLSTGHIFKNGVLHKLHSANVEVTYDQAFQQTGVEARLVSELGELMLTGEVLSATPLRHVKAEPDGSEATVRIVKAMTRFGCEGRSAFGMSEFLDVMIGDQPISMTRGERLP